MRSEMLSLFPADKWQKWLGLLVATRHNIILSMKMIHYIFSSKATWSQQLLWLFKDWLVFFTYDFNPPL